MHQWPWARIAGGPGLPDRVIRRLLCSGRIRTVLYASDGGDAGTSALGRAQRAVLDLGRSHRVVSKRLFRALLLRDGGCAYPGCGAQHGLEAHHVRHWLFGGRTDLKNLVLLCRVHHHAHHDGEFLIVPLGQHRFRFQRADGVILPEHVDPSTLTSTAAPIEADHADVAPDAATTRWDGTNLDHHYAIAALAQRLHALEPPA